MLQQSKPNATALDNTDFVLRKRFKTDVSPPQSNSHGDSQFSTVQSSPVGARRKRPGMYILYIHTHP